jgi:hypothetical protein
LFAAVHERQIQKEGETGDGREEEAAGDQPNREIFPLRQGGPPVEDVRHQRCDEQCGAGRHQRRMEQSCRRRHEISLLIALFLAGAAS